MSWYSLCGMKWNIQGTHKRKVGFKKLTRNLFLTLHGHNVHHHQRQLSKFLMRYQQFVSHAYLRGQFAKWRRSRKRLSVCSILRCPDQWLQCSVSYVHGLEKTHHASFLNCARNSRCTVITDLDTSKRSTQKAFSCCDAILQTGLRPRSKHEKRTAGSAWETWTFAAADDVCCARVRREINFLLTFETAPFFCVYPVFWTYGQPLPPAQWNLTEERPKSSDLLFSSVIYFTERLYHFPKIRS